MKLVGKVHVIQPLIEGETEKGPWKRRDLVLTLDSGRHLAITYGGDLVDVISSLKTGDTVETEYYPESRAYGDKWFTNLRGVMLHRLVVQ